MRFAFVSTMASAPWGGSEVLWSETCDRLAANGHKVFIGYPKWPTEPTPLASLARRHNVPVAWFGRIGRVTDRILAQIHPELVLPRARLWLHRMKPDLICISSGNAFEGAPWMHLARSLKIPFVTLAQAHAEFLWPDDAQAAQLRSLFGSARRCFFVSQRNLELVKAQLGTALQNAAIVANHSGSVGPRNFSWPESEEGGLARWACVARLHPASKGQDLLVQVMRKATWRERPLQISLFGEGPQGETLRRLVNEHGLSEKIVFRGHVPDVEKIWETNELLILPSRYEGRPLALAEAMLCGRPAVATDVGGNSELIQHGHTGFIASCPTPG